MNSHLVTVEVGVEGRTNERMQLDGLTFNQGRLERLNTKTVKGRCAVQHDRVFTDNLFKDIPNFGTLFFHHTLCSFDGGCHPVQFQLRVNERLEQFERHFLWQAALMEFQVRTHGNHRTTGIVDAFTQKVLTETTLLTFKHVRHRFERTLVGTGDRTTTTTVVKQRINRFLKHTFFVTHDDIRRTKLDQALQTVVTVDDTTVKVVQIRRCEAATIKRHQRTQFWRDNRNNFKDHPFRARTRFLEGFDQLKTLDQLFAFGFGIGFLEVDFRGFAFFIKIDSRKHIADGFCTDTGTEAVFAIFFLGCHILVFGQELTHFKRGKARFDHHIVLEIQNALKILERHVEQQTKTARQRLHEPDVGNRCRQFNVAHTFTTYFGQGHFDAALLTDNAAVFHTLVLAAQAFVILHRTKNARTEQTVAFRLKGPVVDGLRFLDFTK